MNKTETTTIRRELRGLKAALTSRQKTAARDIKKHRDLIRKTERAITLIETTHDAFLKSTTARLGILEGRLNS